ncbi:MAG: hypothetical protein AABW51_05530 [Nanoarchaeota archaeon]
MVPILPTTFSSGTPNGVDTSRFKTTISLGGVGWMTVSLNKDKYQAGELAIYAGVLHLKSNPEGISQKLHLVLNLVAVGVKQNMLDITLPLENGLNCTYYFQTSFKVEYDSATFPGYYHVDLYTTHEIIRRFFTGTGQYWKVIQSSVSGHRDYYDVKE